MSALFEFRAGRVDLNEETGDATPLSSRGKLVLKPSSEDESLKAIQWQPRDGFQNVPSDEELMVLPGDIEFARVAECETGRVLSMKFLSSGHRKLFWIQTPPVGDLNEWSAADNELLEKLNDLANQEPEDEEDDGEADADSREHEESAVSTGEPMQEDRNSEPVFVSRAFDAVDRAAFVRNADEALVEKLINCVPDVAHDKESLIEVLESPYFAQALEQIASASTESPALAGELGLERVPLSVEDFLQQIWRIFGQT